MDAPLTVVLRMKKNLRVAMAMEDINPQKLAEMAKIDRTTVYKYTSKYVSCGKIDIWLALSNALGHEGLDWLMK